MNWLDLTYKYIWWLLGWVGVYHLWLKIWNKR